MSLSQVLLVLWVFLVSANYLKWFAVDLRFIGFVGIAFVVVWIIEVLFAVSGRPLPSLKRKNTV